MPRARDTWTDLWRGLRRAPRSVRHRLRIHGVETTLWWIVGQGVPAVTGVPIVGLGRVTDDLYVGRQHARWGKRWLRWRGVDASVSLRDELDDAAHGLALAEHCALPTVDGQAPTLAQLTAGVAFIEGVLGRGGKVYVHCAGGIGRAPTLAAAYLVHRGATVGEAIAQIRATRPFIELTEAQLHALDGFERHRLGRPG